MRDRDVLVVLSLVYDNFQLAAVPEPGNWLPMAGGLVFLSWRAERSN